MTTQKEKDLLGAIRDSEYHNGQDPIGNPVWVSVLHFKGGLPFQAAAMGGIMASLVKKGLAATDGETCAITAQGMVDASAGAS